MITVAIRLDRGDFTLDANFEAPENGVTALFGQSGVGKTTIINALAGLIRPDHGRIAIGARVLFDSAAGINIAVAKRRIGCVFQDGRLFPHMTVRQNLLYGRARIRQLHPALDETVELLGLGSLLDRRPDSLSGGERQRVAIGRALLADPGILLMDEPLTALDVAHRAEILPYLARLRQNLDIPVIFVSHQLEDVIQLADTMVLLDNGRVTTAGPIEAVTGQLDLPTLTGFRNRSAVLSGRVAGQDTEYGLTRLTFDAGSFWITEVDLPSGTLVRLQVRARDVALALSPPTGISVLNVIEAQVKAIENNDGPHVDVRLEAGRDTLWARITRRSAFELGLATGMTVHAMIKAVSLDPGSLGYAGQSDAVRPG